MTQPTYLQVHDLQGHQGFEFVGKQVVPAFNKSVIEKARASLSPGTAPNLEIIHQIYIEIFINVIQELAVQSQKKKGKRAITEGTLMEGKKGWSVISRIKKQIKIHDLKNHVTNLKSYSTKMEVLKYIQEKGISFSELYDFVRSEQSLSEVARQNADAGSSSSSTSSTSSTSSSHVTAAAPPPPTSIAGGAVLSPPKQTTHNTRPSGDTTSKKRDRTAADDDVDFTQNPSKRTRTEDNEDTNASVGDIIFTQPSQQPPNTPSTPPKPVADPTESIGNPNRLSLNANSTPPPSQPPKLQENNFLTPTPLHKQLAKPSATNQPPSNTQPNPQNVKQRSTASNDPGSSSSSSSSTSSTTAANKTSQPVPTSNRTATSNTVDKNVVPPINDMNISSSTSSTTPSTPISNNVATPTPKTAPGSQRKITFGSSNGPRPGSIIPATTAIPSDNNKPT